jgi:hypothetical protein
MSIEKTISDLTTAVNALTAALNQPDSKEVAR